MNRYRLLGLLIFLVTLVAGVAIYWRLSYYRVWLSSTSPNGKYTVELTGDKGRGGFFIYSVVKYNILVDGILLTRGRRLHHGDSMDISFELAYPDHAWIDEKILRFWINRRGTELDAVLISNYSDKKIKFLQIKALEDMFFVFDVEPRSSFKLALTHRTEGDHIWAEGEFEDGSLINYGVGSHERGKPLEFSLTIDCNHVTNK